MKHHKLGIILFGIAIIAILGLSLFTVSHEAKAAAAASVYSLVTSDTTPIIRGTVADFSTTVITVSIDGGSSQTATNSSDGTWSYQSGELAEGVHTIDIVATTTGGPYSYDSHLYLSADYPIELYYEEINSENLLLATSILFPAAYSFADDNGILTVDFPAGTEVTQTGGGQFDLSTWYAQTVDFNNERVLQEIHFGVSGVSLTFSSAITITLSVGDEYNGQTLNIFSRSDVGDEGWEPMDISCEVTNGNCSFNTSHASYFAVSQYNSIAETEEGDLDGDGEADGGRKAQIKSWKAYQYKNNNGVSCPNKLVVEIKGKYLDKDAKVKVGNQKAYSVKKKSSEKIVAKFCMDDLSKKKVGNKRTISVTNPNTEKEKADKKINLAKVDYKKFIYEDFNVNTREGVLNIQKALVSLDLLERGTEVGVYGALTRGAVVEFQKEHNIFQTGYVGPLTKEKLVEELN